MSPSMRDEFSAFTVLRAGAPHISMKYAMEKLDISQAHPDHSQRGGIEFPWKKKTPPYSLIDAFAAVQTPQGKAIVKLEEFRRKYPGGGKVGAFVDADLETLLDQMELRIWDPYWIYQGMGPLCGPCAIVFELVKESPERYVRFMQELYETGKFSAGGLTIEPREELYQEKFHNGQQSGFDLADWIVAATMRDAENILWTYEDDSSISGITTPSEMGDWMKTVLGCKSAVVKTAYFSDEIETFEKAGEAWERGDVVALLIDTDFLKSPEEQELNDITKWVNLHWVLLQSNISSTTDGSRYELEVYNKGDLQPVEVLNSDAENHFYGAVMGVY